MAPPTRGSCSFFPQIRRATQEPGRCGSARAQRPFSSRAPRQMGGQVGERAKDCGGEVQGGGRGIRRPLRPGQAPCLTDMARRGSRLAGLRRRPRTATRTTLAALARVGAALRTAAAAAARAMSLEETRPTSLRSSFSGGFKRQNSFGETPFDGHGAPVSPSRARVARCRWPPRMAGAGTCSRRGPSVVDERRRRRRGRGGR
mmetsp:Transcript_43107/g.140214  ORF Transcript_43107/g.140214 Transcript_43107/m.140214 type:complete len:202 (+) Transcript_43107:61-666(+)